uniref:CaMBD domain-containing protein n=1 Tax=Macrostomum lignano TaxID=282301 RepID=A0A1I8F824_9PLAT
LFSIDNCIEDWRIAQLPVAESAQMLAEVCICAVHPGAQHPQLRLANRTYPTIEQAAHVQVPVDRLFLSLPMFSCGCILIFRVMLLHSKLYHDMLHGNILNSMWLIAITFLSIGYGDIVPNTYCGRAISITTELCLVVAVFARKLELTRAEKHVHNFMMDTALTKRLKNSAANVLRETCLRKVKRDQRKLTDNANTIVDLAKTQSDIFSSVQAMHQEQDCLRERMEKIEDYLISYAGELRL